MIRQELKFAFTKKEVSQVLKENHAYQEHPMRIVNSIYYDDIYLTNFIDGEEGITPRSKFRFRWYGEEDKLSGQYEIKKTHDNYKTKESIDVKFNSHKQLLEFIKNYNKKICFEICRISYKRLYFKDLNNIRYTLDFDIKYINQVNNKIFFYDDDIFEIKFSKYHHQEILNKYGDKNIRFSKYNRAIEKLNIQPFKIQ